MSEIDTLNAMITAAFKRLGPAVRTQVEWLAMDKDGAVHGYIKEPTVDNDNDCWMGEGKRAIARIGAGRRFDFRTVLLRATELPEFSRGAEMITSERARQTTAEGFNAANDDRHVNGELPAVAVAYIKNDVAEMPANWDERCFKPTTKVRDLVKAGALIAAEIDRLLREEGLKL